MMNLNIMSAVWVHGREKRGWGREPETAFSGAPRKRCGCSLRPGVMASIFGGKYTHILALTLNTLPSLLGGGKIHKGINKQAKENSRLPFNYRRVIAMLIIISIKVKSFHHSGMNIWKIN